MAYLKWNKGRHLDQKGLSLCSSVLADSERPRLCWATLLLSSDTRLDTLRALPCSRRGWPERLVMDHAPHSMRSSCVTTCLLSNSLSRCSHGPCERCLVSLQMCAGHVKVSGCLATQLEIARRVATWLILFKISWYKIRTWSNPIYHQDHWQLLCCHSHTCMCWGPPSPPGTYRIWIWASEKVEFMKCPLFP